MFFIQSVATGPYYSSYKTESRYVNNLGRYKANPFFDGNRLGMLRGGLWRGFRKIELEQLSGHVTKHVIQMSRAAHSACAACSDDDSLASSNLGE